MSLETNYAIGIQANGLEPQFKLIIIDLTLFVNCWMLLYFSWSTSGEFSFTSLDGTT